MFSSVIIGIGSEIVYYINFQYVIFYILAKLSLKLYCVECL